MDGFRCIPCRSGFYSDAGARECTPCAAGTVSVPSYIPDGTTTFNKPYTQYNWLFASSSACQACPAGYFQPNLAGTVCIPCPSGEFCSRSPGCFARGVASTYTMQFLTKFHRRQVSSRTLALRRARRALRGPSTETAASFLSALWAFLAPGPRRRRLMEPL